MLKRGLVVGLVTAVLLLAASTAAQADGRQHFRAGPLRVVTQNLYVGGDIFLPFTPGVDFDEAAAEVIGQILSTNYPERAIEQAEQIRSKWPHLVGLQEVYKIKVCYDPAQTVCLINQDYLEILLDNLNAHWPMYREVVSVTNIDIQNLEAELPGGTPIYVSITDRDVTLAHRWVRTKNPYASNFGVGLPLGNVLPGFVVLRGYTMIDALVWGREYRFVNTHIETKGQGTDAEGIFRAVQAAQVTELLSVLAADDHVQIVVGDFNSDPFDGLADGYQVDCLVPDENGVLFPAKCPTPYGLMSVFNPFGTPFIDVWLERRGPYELGNTCCQDTLLDNEFSVLYERVDQVWARPAPNHYGPWFLRNVRAERLGEEPVDKTVPSGLWPSDHAGVAARMIVRLPK